MEYESNNKQANESTKFNNSKSSNKMGDESIDKLFGKIDESLAPVSTTVSLFEVAAILEYLSECDMDQATVQPDFPNQRSYGRHYLMSLLSRCVEGFHENSEAVIETAGELQIKFKERNDNVVQLQSLYKTLIELPSTRSREALDKVKSDILECEARLSLTINDGVVN